MHKLVSAFPFRSTLKSRFSVSPRGKEAGEERGNCLGIAAAKWVKFRAQSWLFHAPAAQHLPGVWRTRCSTSLPCYPKLIDDGFPAGLYLTKRCRELLWRAGNFRGACSIAAALIYLSLSIHTYLQTYTFTPVYVCMYI